MNHQVVENASIVGNPPNPQSYILQPHQMYINHDMPIYGQQNQNNNHLCPQYPQQQHYQNENLNYHPSTCSPSMRQNPYQYPPQQQEMNEEENQQQEHDRKKNQQRYVNNNTNVIIVNQQPGPYISPIMIDNREQVCCCQFLFRSFLELITLPFRLIGWLCKLQWNYCTGPIVQECCGEDQRSSIQACGQSIQQNYCCNHTKSKEEQQKSSDDDDIVICMCQGGGVQICCTLLFHSIGYSLDMLWQCCADCRTSCWNMIMTPIFMFCRQCSEWVQSTCESFCTACCSCGDICKDCNCLEDCKCDDCDCDCQCDDD